jgi:hypothetical protein
MVARDFMLPDFVLSIVMRPDAMTEFFRSMAHKNDRSAAPVPTGCGKTIVSILLQQPTPTIAQPKIGIDNAALEYRPRYDLWRGHRPCRGIREIGRALERTAR